MFELPDEPFLLFLGAVAVLAKLACEFIDWLIAKEGNSRVRSQLEDVWFLLIESDVPALVHGVLIAVTKRVESYWAQLEWRWAKLVIALYCINLLSSLVAAWLTDADITGKRTLAIGVLVPTIIFGFIAMLGLGILLAAMIYLLILIGRGLASLLRSRTERGFLHRISIYLREFNDHVERFGVLRGSRAIAPSFTNAILGFGLIVVVVGGGLIGFIVAGAVTTAINSVSSTLVALGASPPVVAAIGVVFDLFSTIITWSLIQAAGKASSLKTSSTHLVADGLVALAACCWLPALLGVLSGAPTIKFLIAFFTWDPRSWDNNFFFLIMGVSAALPTFLYGSVILAALLAHAFHRIVRPVFTFTIERITNEETPVFKRLGNVLAGLAAALGAIAIIAEHWGAVVG